MNPTDSIVCKFSHADCKSDCDQPTANSFDLAPPNPSKPTGDQPYKTLSPPTHAIDTWSIAGKLEAYASTLAYSLPKVKSTTQHPRTCGPSPRQWPMICSSSQPASINASA